MKMRTKRYIAVFLAFVVVLAQVGMVPVSGFDYGVESIEASSEAAWDYATGAVTTPAAIASMSGSVVHQGTVGTGGAPWRLYSDGTLVVDSGVLSYIYHVSPWFLHANNIYRIYFTGQIDAGISLAGLFQGLINVVSIEGLEHFNTNNVRYMWSTFSGARSLTSLDISMWDTSNVVFMSAMFSSASSLTSLDISMWDTSNVVYMSAMFSDASSLTNLDLSQWDTSNVRNMSQMFVGASNLTRLDLSGWDTSNVRNMDEMFAEASSLISLNLSGWDTRNVNNMTWMFGGMSSLRQLSLGEQFRFVGDVDVGLPSIQTNNIYTGRWQNVGTGTSANPQGAFSLTSAQLMENFDGSTMADTWVWERVATQEPTVINISTVAEGASGPGWSFRNNILNVYNNADITVTGVVSNGRRIEVASNVTASVTFNNLIIGGLSAWQSPISLFGNANLTLNLVGTNNLVGGMGAAGIFVTAGGATLNIVGEGELTARAGSVSYGSNRGGAGIGSNGSPFGSDSTGIINIGGNTTVTAFGSGGGAGIGSGGGDGGSGAVSVTIRDNANVNATGGNFGGAGIGSGTSIGSRPLFVRGGLISISGNANVTANGGSGFSGFGGAGIGSGHNGARNLQIIIESGSVTAVGSYRGAGIGSGPVNVIGNIENDNFPQITISGGDVNATGGIGGAGIGGGRNGDVGNIQISGGNVTAIGGYFSAGIGGGSSSNVGSIIISDGEVNAIGGGQSQSWAGQSGAGIGGGGYGHVGEIIINGGKVTAKALISGAGIGSGGYGEAGIIIVDGNAEINAFGSFGGAGIGGGYRASGGNITIENGSIIARSDDPSMTGFSRYGRGHGAGIGGGRLGAGGEIFINGGIIEVMSASGAGIGGGLAGNGGVINITSGVINSVGMGGAVGNGAGIGGGEGGCGGNINIIGDAIVTARGSGFGGAGIGGGGSRFADIGSGGNIIIDGNSFVRAYGAINFNLVSSHSRSIGAGVNPSGVLGTPASIYIGDNTSLYVNRPADIPLIWFDYDGQPQNAVVVQGDTHVLSASIDTLINNTLRFQWYHNGYAIQNQNANDQNLNLLPELDIGSHTFYLVAKAEDASGIEVSSNEVLVTVINQTAQPRLIVSNTEGRISEIVPVSVSLENNPGIVSAIFNVHFDNSALRFAGFRDTGLLNNPQHPPNQYDSPVRLSWIDHLGSDNTNDGEIVILEFEILDAAVEGSTYEISLVIEPNGIVNADLAPVSFIPVPGGILVRDFTFGDVDDRGDVNAASAILLTRYVSGWPITGINRRAADVNVDGYVNVADAIILTRHVSGWSDFATLPWRASGLAAPFNAQLLADPVVAVDSGRGLVGETIQIPVRIEDNPGIVSMMFNVNFDSNALRFVEFQDTGLLRGPQHPPEQSGAPSVRLSWMDALATDNNSSNGVILNLTFEILRAGRHDISVAIEPNSVLNAGLDGIDFYVRSGNIQANVPPPVTLILNPTSVTVNNTSLVASVTAGGTATGGITFNRGTLPAAVQLTASGNTITVTGIRPAAGQAAVTGTHTVMVNRGEVSTPLTVNVNLTPQQPVQPAIIPGDVFGDGRPITTATVTRLRLYLAGHQVPIVRAAADVTGTGNVTTADVTRLRLYLAGHPVRLLPSPLAR